MSALRTATLALVLAASVPLEAASPQHNVIIFVADGLRYDSVTPQTAPTMYKLRQNGVDFADSHAVYPTLTTANASAIATGHFLGDTGDYANTLYTGFPVRCGQTEEPGSVVSFVEDDCVLRAIKEHFGKGYIGQTTLLQAARAAGYNTVLIGKKGPLAIQSLDALDSTNSDVSGPLGIFIDEATNRPKNLNGTATMSTMLGGDLAQEVSGATGASAPPFTTAPNLTQQAYLVSAATQAIIPNLKNAGKPFVMLYWSRDPDTTQHGAHDSEGSLVPGINSIDSHTAIANADRNLKDILDALKRWGIADNTDVIVIADHGFSTIGKGIPGPDGSLARTTLAQGFVAFDVAKWLGQKLFDPDRNNNEVDADQGQRPANGSALIGPSADAPEAIVAANGGSDFVYVPEGPSQRATAKKIMAGLVAAPYVGALFVNDDVVKGGDPKDFAGALPMSAVSLMGAGGLPKPTIVIGFRSFVAKGCKLGSLLCAAEIADTPLQTGQGMHGAPSRADSRNFMAAIGPDFKARFVDKTPVGNVDVAPTVAHILHVDLTGPGDLKGRPVLEALTGGKPPEAKRGTAKSEKAANGFQTVLEYEEVGSTRYFDAAGAPGRTVGLTGR